MPESDEITEMETDMRDWEHSKMYSKIFVLNSDLLEQYRINLQLVQGND